MPNTICASCDSKLELLSSFRNVCLRSNETSKLRLNEGLNIKPEEVLLEDLNWEDTTDVNSIKIDCNSGIEQESNALQLCDAKQNVNLIENVNALVKRLVLY